MAKNVQRKISDSQNAVGGNIDSKGNVEIGDHYDNRRIINISVGSISLITSVSLLLYLGVIRIPFPKQDETSNNDLDSTIIVPNPSEPSTINIVNPVSPKPVESEQLEKYIYLDSNTDIAFYQSNNLELFKLRKAVQEHFKAIDLTISSSFFKPAFAKRFGNNLPDMDFAILQELDLSQKLHCICQIKEDIDYKESELEGVAIITAYGEVKLMIQNLSTGSMEILDLGRDIRGTGVSRSAALISFEDKILQSNKLEEINISYCK